ncbi:TIGR04222 domain-containing membrane protein [Actinokineospora globicatena]|uniref:TIGR04222 domain-containing membrane protein n=1 Tax=Actinokineospora globicatena TaxID=103729 RepID=UPI0024A0BC43|nr:TIGR04222 domain-containing membrane protein [Actinokineospora globicatena]MCP2306765.1 TIGR04222 domain-containing protein [Actinokineospora globicatena]GLW82116.1 hypothetical protein Aglo01_65970 [Actinokineospora globicatena]GLW88909.1 hypothetical protein Aglo02_65480 [Actinokineospora globicatena]
MIWSWLVLFVAAMAAPVWVVVRDYRRARDASLVAGFAGDLVDVALLRGGVARVADAVVVDLVDRGALTVTDTNCLVPGVEPAATTPMEQVILDFACSRTVRLRAVRDEVADKCADEFKKRTTRLRRKGLLVAESGSGLAFLILHSFLVYTSGAQFMYWIDGIFVAEPLWLWDGPTGRAWVLLLVLWAVPFAVVTWHRGFLREDIRTPLGRAIIDRLVRTAPESLGTWVAVHGLATTDPDPDDPRPLILGDLEPA